MFIVSACSHSGRIVGEVVDSVSLLDGCSSVTFVAFLSFHACNLGPKFFPGLSFEIRFHLVYLALVRFSSCYRDEQKKKPRDFGVYWF